MRDANSAPLQRIQVVKGWLDASGKTQEKVFDVACSDGGTINPSTHRCADNGASVDIKTCAFSQDKGDAELSASWSDPEFDPKLNAFYYARVIEIPMSTPPPSFPRPTLWPGPSTPQPGWVG